MSRLQPSRTTSPTSDGPNAAVKVPAATSVAASTPSIETIRSPRRSPARSAGEPGITKRSTTVPASIRTPIPSPTEVPSSKKPS